MKLIYRLTTRISAVLLLLITAWAVAFYFVIMDEVNDETNDALEDYSEMIIRRALAGEDLPSLDSGTNNGYFIAEVSPEYARANREITYADEMVYIEAKRETEPARIMKTVFSDSDNRYYELTVSIPTIEKQDLRESIMWWIIILYITVLAAIIIINLLIINRSFRPLYALLKWLDNYSMDRDPTPLDEDTNISEFRRLNEAMMRSARRNAELYRQQSEFIGNASHELQTPLAVCLNRIEMLAEDDSTTEKQLGEMMKIHESLRQAIKLNKTLLMITRIENRQYTANDTVDAGALLEKLAEDYSEVYRARGITVLWDKKEDLSLTMDETLARVMFSNLLRNAFLYNRPGGYIRVTVESDGVTISNTGQESPLDGEKIFLRFYKAGGGEGASGLGLSIVEAVCRIYGFGLGYEYSSGVHIFSVRTGKKIEM